MKEFFITIGGKDRRLRYTSSDSIRLFQRFGKPLRTLVREDLMGLDADNKATREFRPDVQLAFLHLGLAHDIPRLTEDQVTAWIDQLLEEGGDIQDVVTVATKAAYYSGIVLGVRYDVDAEQEKAQEQIGEGKGQAAPEPPTSTPPAVPAAE